MNGRFLAFLLIAAALPAGAAKAQNTHDEYLSWCRGADIDRKMLGCSALINSGQETPETLAIAYLDRGNAVADNGQIDLTIQTTAQHRRNHPPGGEAFGRRCPNH